MTDPNVDHIRQALAMAAELIDHAYEADGVTDEMRLAMANTGLDALVAEIERLHRQIALLELNVETLAKGQHLDELQRQLSKAGETMKVAARESSKEIGKLTARIMQLEAQTAIARGSLALPPQPDEPAAIVHDVPPNAPR
jgi:predicted  nucleic acid-binding Zn-ribbon protein